jgi:hypothetical protein
LHGILAQMTGGVMCKNRVNMFKPELSDFLLDLHRSPAHQGFAKILNIAMGMPAVFAKPYASGSQHISSEKIAQFSLKENYCIDNKTDIQKN